MIFDETEDTYVEKVNKSLIGFLGKFQQSVIYGQNITTGSRISGLGKNLESVPGCFFSNTPNSENLLSGVGFGLSVQGIPSVFLMKQHDFAILGLDQFSNTFNSTRYNGMLAPFVVLMVVVDSGYEGPQASLNNLDDFASLTRGQVHFLSTLENIEKTFKDLEEPGLHFVALSQYEMKKKVLKAKNKYIENSSSILYKNLKEHQNSEKKILVVSYGVNTKSVKATLKLCSDLNIYPDLLIINRIGNFSINEELNFKHDYLHVIIIDDSKSENKYSKNLAFQLLCDSVPVTYFERKFTKEWTEVFSDEFIIPFDQLKKSLIG